MFFWRHKVLMKLLKAEKVGVKNWQLYYWSFNYKEPVRDFFSSQSKLLDKMFSKCKLCCFKIGLHIHIIYIQGCVCIPQVLRLLCFLWHRKLAHNTNIKVNALTFPFFIHNFIFFTCVTAFFLFQLLLHGFPQLCTQAELYLYGKQMKDKPTKNQTHNLSTYNQHAIVKSTNT